MQEVNCIGYECSLDLEGDTSHPTLWAPIFPLSSPSDLTEHPQLRPGPWLTPDPSEPPHSVPSTWPHPVCALSPKNALAPTSDLAPRPTQAPSPPGSLPPCFPLLQARLLSLMRCTSLSIHTCHPLSGIRDCVLCSPGPPHGVVHGSRIICVRCMDESV